MARLSVKQAINATEAASLGGQPAANYLRSNACQPGSVLGYAKVIATPDPTFSTNGVTETRNCSGGTVEARNVTTGRYEVRFNGNPGTVVLANPTNTNNCDAIQVTGPVGPGTFSVTNKNFCLVPPASADTGFVVVVL